MRNHLYPFLKQRMSWNNEKPLSWRNGCVTNLGTWCVSMRKVNRGMKPWTGVVAIVDDNYLMGPPEAIFPANRTFDRYLREIGLKLNPAKSKCYINSAHMDARWDKLRGEIPNGTLSDASGVTIMKDGTPLFGFTACNVPIGLVPFVRGYLVARQKKIV